MCTCKGGRTWVVLFSFGSLMTWTIARSEWLCPPWGRADVTFSMPYKKGGLHPGNQIKTHIRRQLIWASFLSAPCTGRENIELEGKIGSVKKVCHTYTLPPSAWPSLPSFTETHNCSVCSLVFKPSVGFWLYRSYVFTHNSITVVVKVAGKSGLHARPAVYTASLKQQWICDSISCLSLI